MGSGTAVCMSSAFTWSGVSSGCCCRMVATAPETIAAACDDPLPLRKRGVVPTRAMGLASSTELPGSRRLTIDLPGATMSGCLIELPRDCHDGMESSLGSSVPLVSSAPTAIT